MRHCLCWQLLLLLLLLLPFGSSCSRCRPENLLTWKGHYTFRRLIDRNFLLQNRVQWTVGDIVTKLPPVSLAIDENRCCCSNPL